MSLDAPCQPSDRRDGTLTQSFSPPDAPCLLWRIPLLPDAHSPVRVWGEKCTRYNKEGTWHGTRGFECRLLHTLSRIRIFAASTVHFQSWRAVNRIFEARSHYWGAWPYNVLALKITALLSINIHIFEYSSSSLQSILFAPTPQIKQTYCQA